MINSIGLQNIGVEAFCRDVLPGAAARGAMVVVNVFGERPDAYAEVIARCEREHGVAGYELNVSCPNVTAGGMEFGHDPALLERSDRSVPRGDAAAAVGQAVAQRAATSAARHGRRWPAAPTS